MAELANGGPIVGVVNIRIERIGQGLDGMCIYSVNGRAPRSIIQPPQMEALRALLKRDKP